MRRLAGGVSLLVALFAALAAGCSGGSSSSPVCTATGLTGLGAPLDVETQLEAIVLQADDVPDLQRSSLTFSSNEDLAASAPDFDTEMAKLKELGRSLGVEAAFLPRDPGSSASPVKGGIQNSVSIYRGADGASRSLQEGIAGARQTDWEARYPELTGVEVREIARTIGDESVWFRITGSDPGNQTIVDDQVAFRAGRARVFLRVVSSFADEASVGPFADQVEDCAGIVVERARAVLENGVGQAGQPG